MKNNCQILFKCSPTPRKYFSWCTKLATSCSCRGSKEVGQQDAGWDAGGSNNLQSCSHFSPRKERTVGKGVFVRMRLLDPHFCPLLANSISPATNSQQGIQPHPEPQPPHPHTDPQWVKPSGAGKWISLI